MTKRSWTVRAGIAATVALGTACAAGLYLHAGDVFLPGYFLVLRLHIALGVAALVLGIPALFEHTRSRGRAGRWALGGVLVLCGAIAFGPDPDWFLWAEPVGRAALGASATLALLLGGVTAFSTESERRFSVLGILLTFASVFTLWTGWECWTYRGEGRFELSAVHGWSALTTSVLLLLHAPVLPRLVPPRARRLVGVLPGVVLAGALLSQRDWLIGESFRMDGVSARAPATATERAEHRGLPGEGFMASATCGDAGCHPTITAQWEGSAHRFAADNDLYRAVVAQLVSERGPTDATFCANCHDPMRVVRGEVDVAYADGAPPPGEGVSCMACHAAVTVHEDALHNGIFTHETPIPYPGDDLETRKARIRLDPRFHREQMNADHFLADPRSCGPCHRVVVGPDIGAAHAVLQAPFEPHMYDHLLSDEGSDAYAARPGTPVLCAECHMPTTATEEGRHDVLYDHHFAGINLELPSYARHPEARTESLEMVRERVRRFLDGTVEFEPGNYPDEGPDAIGLGRMHAFLRTSGIVELEARARLVDGALELETTTTNSRAGHAFPVGPMDLQQVWQEVRVLDANGAVLWSVGARDDGRVDPEAHRLGGVERDSTGAVLARHRIWDLGSVTDVRKIDKGGSVEDRYRIELPEGAQAARVEVAWLLRRAGPDFTEWVYGTPGPHFPTHRIAEVAVPVE